MNGVDEKKYFMRTMIAAVLGALMVNTLTAGNDLVSGRTVGMARTFTASSRGLDALGLNPANLALDDRGSTVTFEIAPIGIVAGSDFLNYKIYQDDFTGVDSLDANGKPVVGTNGKTIRNPKVLTQSDKNEILGLFPGGISHTQFSVNVTEFGMTVQSGFLGGIGLSVSDRAAANIDIPEGYLKMVLDAFPPEGANYSLDNTSIKASWIREYNLSYARMLPVQLPWVKDIAVGVGIKYEQGFAYFGTDHYSGNISVIPTYTQTSAGPVLTAEPISGSVNFLQYSSQVNFDSTSNASEFLGKPAGRGLGFDIGVSGEVFEALRVGISLTDIGKMTWSQSTKAIDGSGGFTISDITQQDSLKNAFKGEKHDTSSFKTSLPTALHIGGALQVDKAPFVSHFPGQLLVAADLNVGFNNEPGNTTTPRFSLGTEYRPVEAFPIRTGISIGGRERFEWAFGFGFNTPVWDLDLGTQSIALLTNPNSFHNASITLGMRFRI
jgi:Family of unknown function (DUF5723)